MTFELRPYQAAAIGSVRGSWAAGKKRPLLVAPTGAGKTQMAEALLQSAQLPMAIVHTDVLLEQTARRIPSARVYTIQSLIAKGTQADLRRLRLKRHDMCFIDEAHHLAAGQWSTALPYLGDMRVFGCTATPMRSDGTPLGDCFDDLIVAAQYSQLVKDGFLCPCDVARSEIPRNEQKEAKIRPDGVQAYLQHCPRRDDGTWRPGIHFEVTIEACEGASRRYQAAGLRSEVVSCHTGAADRKRIFAEYTAGELDMLCSPTALAEGFDSPRAEVCVLRRSCDHLGDYMQRVGRVLRPFPGKERALLIDITGASAKHSLPTDDRVYSLSGKAISALPPVQEEEPKEKAPPSTWEMVQSRYQVIRDTLLSRYRDLCAQAADYGYKPGWVWHKFTQATSITPPRSFESKYASTCVHCRKRVAVGETIFWDGTKRVYHQECWFAALDGERLGEAQQALELDGRMV